MSSALSSFRERITERASRLSRVAAIALAASLVLVGCNTSADSPRPVSGEVERGLEILQTDGQVIGAVRVSEFYRSFFTRLESRLHEEGAPTTRFTEMHRRFAKQLGVDPLTEEVTVLVSLDGLQLEVVPSLVALAPIPQNRLAELADQFPGLERLDVELPEHAAGADGKPLPVYAVRENGDVVMVTRPSPDVLVATSSVTRLAEMILASRGESLASEPLSDNMLRLVSGADAWWVVRDVPGIFNELPSGNAPEDIRRIARSIEAMSASIETREESLLLTAYLRPREGIATDDLSDLVRGLVALFKLNEDRNPEAARMAEEIEVGSVGNLTRVRIDVSEADLERWATTKFHR